MQLLESQDHLELTVKPTSWDRHLHLPLEKATLDLLKEEMSSLLFLVWDKLNETTRKLQGYYVWGDYIMPVCHI